MSIFKFKESWSKSPGSGDEFSPLSIAPLSFDKKQLLVTSSLNGVVRIYDPSEDPPGDELLELKEKGPIYQCLTGHLLSSSQSFQIALLFPRSVKVCYVNKSGNDQGLSGGISLESAYEHTLERNSFNMASGSFGQSGLDRDFICVQSVDGFLTFFEQETKGIICQLPKFLLPGPLVYVPSTDSFAIGTYSHTICSYKYQNLAASQSSGKTLKANWEMNVGELVLDMSVAIFEYCPPCLLALCERSIVCLLDNGAVRFVKKLDCSPISILPYGAIVQNSVNYLVSTTNSNLLIFRDQHLLWSCQLPFSPMNVKTISCNSVPNHLVLFGGEGQVVVGYLGSDPDLTSYVGRLETRSLDSYESMQGQLMSLKSSLSGRELSVESRDDSQEKMVLSFAVPFELDPYSKAKPEQHLNGLLQGSVPSITVNIFMKSKTVINDVNVLLKPVSPISALQTQYYFTSACGGRESETLEATFFMSYNCVPSTLDVSVVASYKTSAGSAKVTETAIKLPLNLCCFPCEPKKNQAHKVTVDFNSSPVPLNEIFTSFGTGENPSAMGFHFYSGSVVSVLAASKSNRYRFQSDEIEAIWPVLNEFQSLLTQKLHDESCLSYSGQIPSQELLNAVEVHFQLRLSHQQLSELLAQRSSQFRVIQKRLLTKFKDKNPESLLNMDALLEGTYRQVLSLADAIEENEGQLQVAGTTVACICKLTAFLFKILLNFPPEELKYLEQIFAPLLLFASISEQGWEEQVDAAVTYLLKTNMSKDSREEGVQTVTLERYPSPEKLLRHLRIFLERLQKGIRPSGGSAPIHKPKVPSKLISNPPMGAEGDVRKSAIMEENDEEPGDGEDMFPATPSAHALQTPVSNGLEHFETLT